MRILAIKHFWSVSLLVDIVTDVATPVSVPAGSPSRGGDVTVYVLDKSKRGCPLLLLCTFFSVFIAVSTVFHSTNFPDNSPLSHSVLVVLFCLVGSFNYNFSSQKSPSALV